MSDWNSVYEDFMTSLEGSKADKTVKYYHHQVKLLVAWSKQRGIEVDKFQARDMRAYLAYRKKTVSDRTLRHDATTCRVFFRFAHANDYIPTNPLAEQIIPRAAQPCVYMPSEDEVRRIIRALISRWEENENEAAKYVAPKMRRFLMLRNYAIITGLIETGCRVSEILNLKTSDYQPDRRQIVIAQSKTKTPRVIPIGEEWMTAVNAWLRVRPTNTGGSLLFYNEYGDRITPTQMGKSFRKYLAVAGLKNITLHSLRHYTITSVAKVDVWAASQMAGHANLNTTRSYLHGDPDHVRAVHDEASTLKKVMVHKRTVAERKKRIV